MYMNYINISKHYILYTVIRRHSIYSYQGSLMIIKYEKNYSYKLCMCNILGTILDYRSLRNDSMFGQIVLSLDLDVYN